jgi:hypothetical protein
MEKGREVLESYRMVNDSTRTRLYFLNYETRRYLSLLRARPDGFRSAVFESGRAARFIRSAGRSVLLVISHLSHRSGSRETEVSCGNDTAPEKKEMSIGIKSSKCSPFFLSL